MKKTQLAREHTWQRWESEPADLDHVDPILASRMLLDILLIREFEHALLALQSEGLVWGPVHTSVGQEAIAAGAMAALERGDQVNGTHRAHHHFLAKSLCHAIPDGWNAASDGLPDAAQDVITRTLAEIMGLETGYCAGRGGSQHLCHLEAGFLGAVGIVGGCVPIATGAAFAEKFWKSSKVAVTFFGDGAINQGAFHEACNLAGIWWLPAIYVVENNLYAEATHVTEACAVEDLSIRSVSYNMPGFIVDGNDPLGVHACVKHAADRAREGLGPSMIEAKTYRHYDHGGGGLGSDAGYRSKEEEQEWLNKDAAERFPEQLVGAGVLSADEIARIRRLAAAGVAASVDSCTTGTNPRKIREELWPKPETKHEGVRVPVDNETNVQNEIPIPSGRRKVQLTTAIAEVIARWFERDDGAVLIGEEVGHPGSILHSADPTLPERYAERIFNTPISEAGFVGLGLGAALRKMRPIIEIMYPNFGLVAADQLFNQIGKLRYMTGGRTDLSIVVRTKVSIGYGYGDQHSMNPSGLFALFPGWRIVAPSNAIDYIGLFNTAMETPDPVLIIEYRSLYTEEFNVPEGKPDHTVPLGKAKVVASGEDLTVITYGALVGRITELREQLMDFGISADVVDLRTIDPLGIDYDTIGTSLRKTGAAVIIEEAGESQGVHKTIAYHIAERYSDFLNKPVVTLACRDVNPVSRVLESAVSIDDREILDAIRKGAGRG